MTHDWLKVIYLISVVTLHLANYHVVFSAGRRHIQCCESCSDYAVLCAALKSPHQVEGGTKNNKGQEIYRSVILTGHLFFFFFFHMPLF